MKEIITYFVHANIALGIFYLIYRLVLRNEPSFNWNRIYLLVSAFVSIAVPMISIPGLQQAYIVDINLNEVLVYNLNSGNANISLISHGSIIYLTYLIGVIISLGLLFLGLIKIAGIVINNPRSSKNGYVEVQTQNGQIFSFFNYLFNGNKVPLDTLILKHELIHIRQLHTVDVLFFELLAVFFWFNPICYLYKRSIKEVHEFIADEEALPERDNYDNYAKMLVSHALHVPDELITTNFIYHSMLRRRILMLSMGQTRKRFRGKYVVFLIGLVCILFTGTSFEAMNLVSNISVKVYDQVDVKPIFPGGMSKLYEFVAKTLVYPELARQNNIEGTVHMRFTVGRAGVVSNATIIKGIHKLLDDEAMRMIELMPNWMPGKNNNEDVAVFITMPIRFTTNVED